MARLRLSGQAQSEVADFLATSAARWGTEGRRRYAALLTTAMLKVADEPEGKATRSRADLMRGIRRPVHVLYYRIVHPGLIDIVRVLHERMEPSRHIGPGLEY